MDSPDRDSSEPPLDHAQPFKGVVVCCTSIPPDQRTELAKKTEELGGIHKYDLTPDVTHLVVGDYDTPKYRHVAKERTDIKAMDARWIDAVGELWMADAEIDFRALEREWQLKPLETCGEMPDPANPGESKRGSLLLCMTGFDDPEYRNQIIDRITDNGGTYTGDLTKRVSHLIVFKPEGKKYKAARSWNIRTVSLQWLDQTIERGMILDETCFDPVLPTEEQGQGAWNRVNPRRVSLGKRSRSGVGEDGQRKLRKTASMKLSSQRDTLWGDILGSKQTGESSAPERGERIEVADSGVHDAMRPPAPDAGIFSACHFFMAGFELWKSKILAETIGSLGGTTHDSFEAMASTSARPVQRFLIIPQEFQPSTHFQVPPADADTVQIVTEFFIERCLHNKALCDPNDHVLGRPFPMFPISGFEDLSVCTAGFTGVDLLHVEKAIRQIGAKYAARLNEATSVLVCKSLVGTRKEKLKFAFDNDIPIVSSEWLWDSITTGYNVPVEQFMFPELKQSRHLRPKPRTKEQPRESTKQPLQRTRSEPVPPPPKKTVSRHTSMAAIDPTAFQDESRQKQAEVKRTATKEGSAASLQFQTARTHQMDSFRGGTVAAPPASAPSSALNKPPTSQQTEKPVADKARATSVADSAEPTPIPVLESRSVVEQWRASQGGEAMADAPMGDAADGEEARVEDDGDSNVRKPTSERPTTSTAEDSQAPDAEKEDEETQLRLQRDAQKKAEKEALSSKLTSLIESAATTDPAHDEEHQQQQPTRRPRKRGIFGRAISNASAASSGSAESRIDAFGRPAEGSEQQHDPEPPSTQVQYEDPDAKQHRAKVMSRMRGEEVKAPAPSATSRQGGKQKIGRFEFDVDGAIPTRRQTRRNF
ncbi:brct domain-containing protein [Colletotrichum plurivorum]|uniref:Brct domain-containing protein n=1 Tax=Colletotrichum plurivorum TaxID=2175906 RepID=A0A8H6KVA1_9PEZI|nr:brct domain-containing protein [Colletotrichum plurivorum]